LSAVGSTVPISFFEAISKAVRTTESLSHSYALSASYESTIYSAVRKPNMFAIDATFLQTKETSNDPAIDESFQKSFDCSYNYSIYAAYG